MTRARGFAKEILGGISVETLDESPGIFPGGLRNKFFMESWVDSPKKFIMESLNKLLVNFLEILLKQFLDYFQVEFLVKFVV